MESIDPELRPAALAALVDAVAGRLRSLGEARLGRPPMRVGLGIAEPVRATGPSVAERAYALAQLLEDLAADGGGRPARPVPRLADLSAGDQVAVTGHELVATVEVMGSAARAGALCQRGYEALSLLRADL